LKPPAWLCQEIFVRHTLFPVNKDQKFREEEWISQKYVSINPAMMSEASIGESRLELIDHTPSSSKRKKSAL
jgi:hypothetical protein